MYLLSKKPHCEFLRLVFLISQQKHKLRVAAAATKTSNTNLKVCSVFIYALFFMNLVMNACMRYEPLVQIFGTTR